MNLEMSGSLTNEPSVPTQQKRPCPWLAPATSADSDGGLLCSGQLSGSVLKMAQRSSPEGKKRTEWGLRPTLSGGSK